MLHNTGLYGPNEASGTPVNMTPTGQMNIVGNINHLAKLGHGNTPTPSGPYSLGDYGSYHNQFNMGTQIPQYPNHHYQHLGYPGSFSNYNHGAFNEGSYQNGMVPMNLNVHSDHNTNIYNYPYDRTSMESVKSDINKESNIGKMPLNIPQIPNKPYYNNDYVHNDSFHNSNQDLNLSMKPHERLPLDNVRRKKIENTVKLIENILINSTNMNKVTPPESIREKSIDSSCNKSTVSETETEPLLETHEDALSLTMKETKTVVNQERPSIIKSPVTVTEDKSEDSYVDDASIENDDIEKPDEDSSDEGDVKPVIPTAMLEVETSVNVLKDIEIKVEESFSWTDTDYAQPFFKDCHVLLRDQVGDLTIVDSETSVNVATTAIQTGLESNICYECPHCSVIIKSPKRFLIHNKWHTFGLTMEKRTELQREREEKRNQRREAKILERMKAEELTDKKNASKAWPCKDCEKVFGTKGSLKNHRQREHPSRVRECRICHKPVIGWIALRNHMATHVADTGAGFQCHKCPKKFKYSHSLAKHSDTHLEKTHGCAECPKKFGSQTLLKMHMKSHERHHRGTTFRCTYCAKGFYEAYTLQVHERTHRNERPFLCEICKTSFGTNSSLKRHLKVSHSTSKPFECPVCHRSFSTEAIRDRHQLRLHGKPEDFKFPCKLCHCKYGQLKDLQKHVYKAHPKNKRKKKVKDEDLSDDSE